MRRNRGFFLQKASRGTDHLDLFQNNLNKYEHFAYIHN